ncbi:hypothetical protein D6851_02560 [Altericroceibacterium spongiae]|uniref:Uncharacterized protein n=1 Tax=Altericroceibacterium spongiae TaxID=2320269 RepID=A0A420ERR6_9SPHN|nr:hypothetical protein [Altericroceibacterium spongiae]RKF23372.1 hypothetical protein D6851_02560 [Altericroceibacterium spongiae]
MQICTFTGARMLGAPKGWDQKLDGMCGILPVADEVDVQSGHNFMYSVWKPTPEQLEALNNGGAIRLGICGESHPVINMGVLTPETCTAAGVEVAAG